MLMTKNKMRAVFLFVVFISSGASSSCGGTNRFKRETSGDDVTKFATNGSRNDLVSSLLSVCSIVDNRLHKNFNESSQDFPELKIDSYRRKWPDKSWDWTLPEIYPVFVKAKGIRETVKVTFEVHHTETAFAARVNSLYFEKKLLNTSTLRRGVNEAEFDVDGSLCRADPTQYIEADFVFFLAKNSSLHTVHASVDVCKFNGAWSDSPFVIGEQYWEKNNRMWGVDEALPLPRFRVLSDPGENIFIKKGENPTIEVEVDFRLAFDFAVQVMLWDWYSGQFVIDTVKIDLPESRVKELHVRNEDILESRYKQKILKVELIAITFNNSVAKDGQNDGIGGQKVAARYRITVDFGSRKMSGKLTLASHLSERRWYQRRVVRHLSTERTIGLRLPFKASLFPANKTEVVVKDHHCDENGNRGARTEGTNCTISCYAFGTDIEAVVIIKDYPYNPPVKITSYMLGDMAVAILDVGPASDENSGLYRCIGFTKNRYISVKKFQLYTTNFTKIDNITVEDLGNYTTRVVCSVSGDQPMNISISVSDENIANKERVDDKIGTLRVLETSENEAKLTLLLCSDLISFPKRIVTCEAKGKLGTDSKVHYLSKNSSQRCNPLVPKMKPEATVLELKERWGREIKLYCEASGGLDMEMMVSSGGRGEKYRIDKNNKNSRSVRDTKDRDGLSISLWLPRKYVHNVWPTIHCGARNEFGEDWIDINLKDYGII